MLLTETIQARVKLENEILKAIREFEVETKLTVTAVELSHDRPFGFRHSTMAVRAEVRL